jgi:chromatin segregation and condensation protein Rec8/ScpA/Scc1 (kleisin family)
LFEELLMQEKTRKGMIILFLALLELIRLGQVIARQKEFFGEIRIYPVVREETV